MIVIGLTGGIGSGKSTVAELLVERGAVLIDADELAREVVEPGRPAYAKVVEHFGDDVVSPDASLDRSAIAAKVFDDPQALAELNAIVHPDVRAEIATRLASEENKDVVVVDIPLLIESGSSDPYGLAGVLVVDAPLDVVIERLVNRRQMSRADAEARLANQATRIERIARADFVIMNMGTLDELEEMVTRAWHWIEGLRAEVAGSSHHGGASPPPFEQP
jgi:dephospho-CoA kinase